MLDTFFEKVAERFAVLFTRLVSFSVERLYATHQAEQRNRLEDLARQYEADGKDDIAASLRRHAAELAADDPACLAPRIVNHVTADDPRALPPVETSPATDLTGLPHFAPGPAKSRRKQSAIGEPGAGNS